MSNNIGMKIKLRRIELKKSQVELASDLGMSQGDISKIENGKRRIYYDEIHQLSEALMVHPMWFFQDHLDHEDKSSFKLLDLVIEELMERPESERQEIWKGIHNLANVN